MTSVGWATLDVIPSMRGFAGALDRGTTPALASAGAKAGRGFSSSFTRALKFGVVGGGIGAAFGIASFIKDSVELEATYGKTMAQMRVATQAPADELQRLDDLAISLGKETVFSAVEASTAMLELAKNGIKPATIEAGALESALTLAAAGGTDLTDAAMTMGNTLNAFRLKGKDSASVAAALAGAANASSASVGSLAEGLQQASTVAADVGFNVQETTGVLAAFANAGIAGSDAGTSLKTMLTRLMPATAKAKDYMDRYGLSFVKANGEFKGAVEIAGELKEGLGELSASERSQALGVIFGSDARRAATILTKEGADGLRDYIKATSDQAAAEEMAQANMEGTAGAIERLKGSWETTKLEFGKEIAPVAADFLDFLAGKVDDLAPKLVDFGGWFVDEGVPKLKRFAAFVKDDVLPVVENVGDFASDAAGFVSDLGGAFDKLPSEAKLAGIATLLAGGTALKVRGGGGGALGALGSAAGLTRPVPVFVTNPGGLGGGGLGAAGAGGAAATFGARAASAVKAGLLKGSIVLSGITIADAILPNPEDNRILDWIDGDDGPGFIPEHFGNGSNPTRADNPWASIYDPKDPKGTGDRIDEVLDAARAKAAGFGKELDLVGARKVDPTVKTGQIDRANDALYRFIGYQRDAGRPITPYINTTSIERAIEVAKTLNGVLANQAQVDRGADGGVTFQHGGTPSVNPRATIGTVNIQAHDYNDFLQQTQRRVQSAGLGGF